MSLWDAAQELGAAAGGIAYADLISDRGQQYANQMGTLASQLQNDSSFKGYGVTTGAGTSTFSPDGSLNLGVGPDSAMINAANQGAMQGMDTMSQAAGQLGGFGQQATGNAQAAMNNAMMDTAGREQDIYNRAMAMQQPMLDQQRAQQQAREYAMGRGGVRGSQFGGTAEDAAMARAQAQASNNAAYQAMGQAQQEMMNQGQLASQFGGMGVQSAGQMGQLGQGMGQMGSNMYNMGYMAPNFQLNALQAGAQGGNMAQTGQLTGTGYGAQLGLGGVQTAVNADKAGSELMGEVIASLMAGAQSEGGGALGSIGGYLSSKGII